LQRLVINYKLTDDVSNIFSALLLPLLVLKRYNIIGKKPSEGGIHNMSAIDNDLYSHCSCGRQQKSFVRFRIRKKHNYSSTLI